MDQKRLDLLEEAARRGILPDSKRGLYEEAVKRGLLKGVAPIPAKGKEDRELSWGETAVDAAKQLGAGALQGVAGMVSLPRDAGQWLGEKAVGGIDRLLGVDPEETASRKEAVAAAMGASPIAAPSYGDVMGKIEGVTGLLPEAQTTTGKYANTIGQFATGLLSPGGAIRKGAMVLAPAVASETAGQATEGHWTEPYARFATALLAGGGAATLGKGQNPIKKMQTNAPTAADVSSATNAAYKKIQDAGVIVEPGAYKSFALKTQAELRKRGLLPEDSGPIADDLKKIMARTNKVNGWTEIDSMRKGVGNLPKTASDTDFANAKIIKSGMDKLLASGAARSTRGVPQKDIAPMILTARELGRRNIIAKQIADMEGKRAGYLGGDESAMRNQFGSYLKGKNRHSLTKAEREAFEAVVRREGAANLLHSAGSRLVSAGVAAAPFTFGTSLLGSALGGAAHLGARALSGKMTKNAVDRARQTVLAGKGAQAKAMSASKKQLHDMIVRALLATEAARRASGERQNGPVPILSGR